MTEERLAAVVVLAAGEGTRMRSATPKVLHRFCGRSMLGHVLAATAGLAASRTLVVVGAGRDDVRAEIATEWSAAGTVVQPEQRGTGHAVRIALEHLPEIAGRLLVVPGDAPLLTPETLTALVEEHSARAVAATLLTAVVPDPTGYGRVVRDGHGAVRAVVEQRDADAATRAIAEVATSVYVFEVDALRAALAAVGTANAQQEEYLPDAVAIMVAAGREVAAYRAADWQEMVGVNDRVQLAEARRLLRRRLLRHWMLAGVTVVDPAATYIGVHAVLEPDATIEPNTALHGRTVVRRGASVGPNTTLTDTEVGERAAVSNATCIGARIGPEATVGPYTYLRPGTVLDRGAKAGAYVEIKAATVGEAAKVPHLSYVGDAEIGPGSNIGAATIFVNYDGTDKHRTVVGEQVRIGSDSMLVAPLTVGDGAYTAAGSVVTDDVPPGALAIGRSRQRTIEGWVARRRPGTAAARAAAAAGRPSGGRPHDGGRGAAGPASAGPAGAESQRDNDGRGLVP